MALAELPGRAAGARAVGVALLLLALLPSTLLADEAGVRTGYPFLDASPPRAPDIVYLPSYLPAGTAPRGLVLTWGPYGVDVESRSRLASGDELLVWGSTRYGATATEALGPFAEGARLAGALAAWHTGRTGDGRSLLYGRVGATLVVIAGALALDELLRVADSLRGVPPSSLVL